MSSLFCRLCRCSDGRSTAWVLFTFVTIYAVAKRMSMVDWNEYWERFLRVLYSQRILISAFLFLVLALYLFFSRQVARRKSDSAYRADSPFDLGAGKEVTLTPTEFVLLMEQLRLENGYMPGWLYYRCKEQDLLDIYEELLEAGLVEPPQRQRANSASRSNREQQETHDKPAPQRTPDPYEILGISPSASIQAVHLAYREIIKKYHPDLVQRMGAEIQELAKKKTTEINLAYEMLQRRLST